jgi:flagellar protein FlaF
MAGRDVEAAVLTKAAVALKKCQDNWTAAGRNDELEAALKFNQRVWTIFQSELGKADNPLPQGLKIDLLRLSAFIDRRTLEMMAYPAPEKLTILIDINHNIAAGLRARPTTLDTARAAA